MARQWRLVFGLTFLSGCGARTSLEDMLAVSSGSGAGAGAMNGGGTGGSTGAVPPSGGSSFGGVAGLPATGGVAGTSDPGPPPPTPSITAITTGSSETLMKLHDVAVGPDGNVAAVGDFSGGYAQFGTNTVWMYPDYQDAWAAVVDHNGADVWATSYSGDVEDSLQGVAYDAYGVTATGHTATNLLRVGEPSWPMKTFADSYGMDVAVGPTGDIFTVGWFNATTDFGGGPLTPSVGADAFVAAFDTFGSWRWNQVFPAEDARATDVVVDAAGKVTVVGTYNGKLDLGVAVLEGENDVFIAQLDANGGVSYGATVWSNDYVEPQGLAATPEGGFVLTGHLHGALEFDYDSLIGEHVGFVVRFDSMGQALWARTIDASGWVDVPGVAFNSQGDLLLAGTFEGVLNTPTAPDAGMGHDAFVLALSGIDGSLLWERVLGGANEQRIEALAVDTAVNVDTAYVGGTFWGTFTAGGTANVTLEQGNGVFIGRLGAVTP